MGSVLPPRAPGIAGARPGVVEGLLPYQRDGVEFLAGRRVGLLLDEMGLGKTPQAIRAADAIGARRLLIVGPAIARTNWARELARFALLPRSVQVVGSGHETIDDAADVVVTSYDLLTKPSILQQLKRRRFDVLIIDEAHALKNRAARRTRAVYGEACDGRGGLVEQARRVWLLTGTPMPNDASEIWTHLRALLPEVITTGGRPPSFPAFLQRYCVVRPSAYGPRVVGMGASIGLRAARCPGLDIDVLDEGLADLIESTASRVLGSAPRRIGRAPKRLLAYRTAEPFGRIRLWFQPADGRRTHLVELLGDGQQYVVAGIHPGTRRPYVWDVDPTLLGVDALTEIDRGKAEQFFTELAELLDMLGYTKVEREGAGGAAVDRAKIDQQGLRGDVEQVAQAVALIPNDNELFPGRTDYIRMGCAIKAACAEDEARGRELWLDWALRWEGNDRFPEGNDPEVAAADWARMKPPFEVGAGFLFQLAAPYGFNAAGEDFAALEPAPDPDAITPDGRPIRFSDAALALRFRRAHARDANFVDAWGKWLIWDGRHWHPDDTRLAFDLATRICSAASNEARRTIADERTAFRVAIKVASASVIGAVGRIAQADRAMARTTAVWDRNAWILNTPAGIVDLCTGDLRAHEPEARCTRIAAVGPAGDASCHLWARFLDQVTGGDADLQAYLQRAVGYCLTGLIREHTLFFAHGPGGNGKGVFLNTVSAILGDYGAVASMDSFTVTHSERHPTDMAMLRGSRLVTAQEVEEGRRWAEARIKALTGGDPITARFMRQDFFTYQPQFKLFVAGNHKPSLKNVDDAIRRRLHLIPFTFKPKEPDRDLADKLVEEWPGILRWAIEGCLEWQRLGLAPPPAVIEATAEYFAQENVVGRWLEERCRRTPGVETRTKKLFADWREWCAEAGEKPGSEKEFSQALVLQRIERGRQSGSRRSCFVGIELIGEFSDGGGEL